jgi:hypothetical protein
VAEAVVQEDKQATLLQLAVLPVPVVFTAEEADKAELLRLMVDKVQSLLIGVLLFLI